MTLLTLCPFATTFRNEQIKKGKKCVRETQITTNVHMCVYYTMVQLVGNVLSNKLLRLSNHRRTETSDNYRTEIFRPMAT